MIGEQFGSWTVLEYSHTTPAPAYKKYYKCVCSCGEEAIIQKQSLTSGASTRCRGCRYKDLTGSSNPHWNGYKEITGRFFKNVRSGAKSRKIDFQITKEQLQMLWEKQNRSCALTGWPLEIEKDASVDRIDSAGSYSIENVQFIHKDLNYMKHVFSQEYFIKACKAVANNL